MRLRLILSTVCLVRLLFSQSATAPEFEGASIKPNKSLRNGIGNRYEPQRMMWTNVPLRILIEESFGVRPYETIGGPGWIDVDKWDIAATTAIPTTRSQKFAMLQTMLVRRFQLQYHRETRTLGRRGNSQSGSVDLHRRAGTRSQTQSREGAGRNLCDRRSGKTFGKLTYFAASNRFSLFTPLNAAIL